MADASSTVEPRDILTFWFGDDAAQPLANASRWFTRDDAFDAEVRTRFAGALERAGRGEVEDWNEWPDTSLALVILLDQFPRNIHRDSPEAFAHDAHARQCTLAGVARGQDTMLTPVQRWFFYMPLMHAEDLALQDRGLVLFLDLARTPGLSPEVAEALGRVVDYAERHRTVIERFGRFPHRNAALGRATTPAEQAWLEAHPDGF
ncbi:MAG TPA: DUF924 family protein [bacterium]|nr:DUF924 family protein [bacterium]